MSPFILHKDNVFSWDHPLATQTNKNSRIDLHLHRGSMALRTWVSLHNTQVPTLLHLEVQRDKSERITERVAPPLAGSPTPPLSFKAVLTVK